LLRVPRLARKAGADYEVRETPPSRSTTSRFATLDRLLARLHANEADLLTVLDRPDVPLRTNGSENDIRCYVTRRKVSAGTRSAVGRDCRDAFLGLAKTCDKLGLAVWD
jgi:Transposase IS66 family